ncbi:hypothetical protein B0H13DRAFT_2337796 [Mycena leptocephala]|nr:hypothetical protein B0H13DRAFT_2337796 [Mycena leptocephala]
MQSGNSSASGFASSNGTADCFGTWDFFQTHSSVGLKEDDPFAIYYPLSLEQLHQRLLWVETAVLGWQLESEHPSKLNVGRGDRGYARAAPAVTSSKGSVVQRTNGRKYKLTAKASVRRSGRAHDLKKRDQRNESNISEILEERRRGRGWQYKVLWAGGDLSQCSWLPGKALEVDGEEALSTWKKQKQLDLTL